MPPSGIPVKRAVFENLETTLAAITAGSDYYTSVARVTRIDSVPIELTEYPAIILTPSSTDYDPPGDATTLAIAGHYRIDATLVIRTRTSAVDELENFIRDVHKAILVDITRGGIAIDTRLTSDRVFYPTDIEEPVAIAELSIEIIYRTRRTDLNVAT
ncbi:hypothetical protein K0U83_10155 [bacterium]|jgi:hypothetical protein|nr:hypothetical protein [bacterium]